MEENKNQNNYPTQVMLTVRGIVGAYVLYQAYSIATSDSPKTTAMWMFVVLFVVCGAGFLATSIKHYILGEYQGGKADLAQNQDAETVEADNNITDSEESSVSEGPVVQVKAAEIIEGETFKEKAVDFRNVSNIETVDASELEELD